MNSVYCGHWTCGHLSWTKNILDTFLAQKKYFTYHGVHIFIYHSLWKTIVHSWHWRWRHWWRCRGLSWKWLPQLQIICERNWSLVKSNLYFTIIIVSQGTSFESNYELFFCFFLKILFTDFFFVKSKFIVFITCRTSNCFSLLKIF